MYSKKQLKQQLCDMGILPTDTVLIHTSMRAIGPVEGGPDGVLDAFCEYLTEGLLLVPTHTWDNVTRENSSTKCAVISLQRGSVCGRMGENR